MINYLNKKAFTLAEVLITLMIIGIIALLTIPNLIKKYEDHQTVAGVKEAYAILSNGVKMAITENGDLSEWDWPDKTMRYNDPGQTDNDKYGAKILSKYFKVTKKCINLTGEDCSYLKWGYAASWCQGQAPYKYMLQPCYAYAKDTQGNFVNSQTYRPRFLLSNNMLVAINVFSARSDYQYIRIFVDINGPKPPERYGYDLFVFYIDSNSKGLVPLSAGACSTHSILSNFWSSCANWVMKYGNVDYKYQ